MPELQAIEEGEELRPLLERSLAATPLSPPDAEAGLALELLAWMVAHGYLDVKVAVPCDGKRKPILDAGIFHEKSGRGSKIAPARRLLGPAA